MLCVTDSIKLCNAPLIGVALCRKVLCAFYMFSFRLRLGMSNAVHLHLIGALLLSIRKMMYSANDNLYSTTGIIQQLQR